MGAFLNYQSLLNIKLCVLYPSMWSLISDLKKVRNRIKCCETEHFWMRKLFNVNGNNYSIKLYFWWQLMEKICQAYIGFEAPLTINVCLPPLGPVWSWLPSFFSAFFHTMPQTSSLKQWLPHLVLRQSNNSYRFPLGFTIL